MRIVYLALGVFLLLNIGTTCRTPSAAAPPDCERLPGGLLHCAPVRGGAGG